MTENRAELGFLGECEPWLLVNTFFPSKVGGRPAWLDVESIPASDRLKCTECGKQLAFLCQVNYFDEFVDFIVLNTNLETIFSETY